MVAIGRSSSWFHSQRKPMRSSVVHDGGAAPAEAGFGTRFVAGMSAISTADTKNVPASTKNGTENAATRSSAPSGGPANDVAHEFCAPQSTVRLLESVGVHDGRHEGLRRVVVEHLGKPEQQRGEEDHRVEERVGAQDGARVDRVRAGKHSLLAQDDERDAQRQDGPNQVGRDHQSPSVMSVGDHAGRKTEQQPRQPLDDTDERDQERMTGDC